MRKLDINEDIGNELCRSYLRSPFIEDYLYVKNCTEFLQRINKIRLQGKKEQLLHGQSDSAAVVQEQSQTKG